VTRRYRPRKPSCFHRPINRLLITFNQPVRQAHGFAAATWKRPAWDVREPRLTGELLLAALKENA
jgi:hypothetical protein